MSNVRLDEDVYKSPRRFVSVPSPIRLVNVGSMEQPYKGQDYLLRAINLCKEHGVNVQAVLLGNGRLRSSLEALCKELNLDNTVRFLGQLLGGLLCFKNSINLTYSSCVRSPKVCPRHYWKQWLADCRRLALMSEEFRNC